MSTEQNKALVRRLYDEAFGKNNTAVIDEIVSASFRSHTSVLDPPNIDGLKSLVRNLHTGFPNLKVTIEDILEERDRVCVRLKVSGTQRGEYMGMAPSGKSMSIDVLRIFRIQGGKIVEDWGVPDVLGMMQQLGHAQQPLRARS